MCAVQVQSVVRPERNLPPMSRTLAMVCVCVDVNRSANKAIKCGRWCDEMPSDTSSQRRDCVDKPRCSQCPCRKEETQRMQRSPPQAPAEHGSMAASAPAVQRATSLSRAPRVLSSPLAPYCRLVAGRLELLWLVAKQWCACLPKHMRIRDTQGDTSAGAVHLGVRVVLAQVGVRLCGAHFLFSDLFCLRERCMRTFALWCRGGSSTT